MWWGWYDLRKPVKWYKIDILSYWYHVKVWIILFPELLLWSRLILLSILSYTCSKAIKNKEKHDVNILYFAVSPFAPCDGFSHVTSHMMFLKWVEKWQKNEVNFAASINFGHCGKSKHFASNIWISLGPAPLVIFLSSKAHYCPQITDSQFNF